LSVRKNKALKKQTEIFFFSKEKGFHFNVIDLFFLKSLVDKSFLLKIIIEIQIFAICTNCNKNFRFCRI